MEFVFHLRIPASDYLRLYQGAAREVVAKAQDGRRVRFSAHLLRPFVDKDGVNGRFRILTDNQHRFKKIERLD